MEIRQSLKAVKAMYLLCALLEIAIVVLWYQAAFPPSMPFWALGALPVILAIFVVIRHIQRRMTKITISSDRLHYETGLLSKATRTLELVKVQDVRVSQTAGQRIFNLGAISMETAGSSSRIMLESIDRPQEVANHILDMARAAGKDLMAPRSSAAEPNKANQSNQS
jgi:membrane protein YdbS with pleckstrin-like domain